MFFLLWKILKLCCDRKKPQNILSNKNNLGKYIFHLAQNQSFELVSESQNENTPACRHRLAFILQDNKQPMTAKTYKAEKNFCLHLQKKNTAEVTLFRNDQYFVKNQ